MTNVQLGRLITLMVTVLVQVLVIPQVQARTRGIERWEIDVIALRVLSRWTAQADVPPPRDSPPRR